MKAAIFIKTYWKDLPFLRHCLQSINKHCRGFSEIVIQCDPVTAAELITWGLTKEKIIVIAEEGDGYMFQQIAKLDAWKQTPADFILYVDSDCVFFKETTPETFLRNGKPWLMKTPYAEVGSAIIWQDITEKAIGFRSEFEWMRRLPLMYDRKTLEAIATDFPSLRAYILHQPHRAFSEFNFIGQYIERYHSHLYEIIDTRNEIPEANARQFWSWGGLTNDITNEIKGFENG